jgi:hypothetical protein
MTSTRSWWAWGSGGVRVSALSERVDEVLAPSRPQRPSGVPAFRTMRKVASPSPARPPPTKQTAGSCSPCAESCAFEIGAMHRTPDAQALQQSQPPIR